MVDKSSFERLYNINVNDKKEDKNGLTYLSWTWAWAEIKKIHPDATYIVKKFENGLPYVYDEKTGYMVFTEVTIDGLTHEMWLPVMDGSNKAMKSTPYTYKNKYGKEFEVSPATMFDINKTIMRCLTKNLAMFGLGLYIYAGEDLPDTGESPQAEPKIDEKELKMLRGYADELNVSAEEICQKYGVESLAELTKSQHADAVRILNNTADKLAKKRGGKNE